MVEKRKKQHWEPFAKHEETRAVEGEVNQQEQEQNPQTGIQPMSGVTPLAAVPAGGLTRRVARIMPSFGTSRQNDAQLYAGPINGTPQTDAAPIILPIQPTPTPPTPVLFSPPIGAGIVRIKVYNTTTAITAVTLTLWDSATALGAGNSELVPVFGGSLTPSSATTASANFMGHFESDLNVTSMTVTVTGGTGGSVDIDLGATSA